MKRNENLGSLLEDVLPASSENCGPSLSTVLDIAARERVRRWRIRSAAAGLAIVLIALTAIFLRTDSPTETAPLIAESPEPEPIIQQIDDAELVDLLDGAPMALMEWPDGSRTLLMVDH